ncbi:MAG: MarR family winged helix-turn-helix transcriptional regulator [Bilifractor sp.]|jgi:DNA-binding MarR family transcriptional regulator
MKDNEEYMDCGMLIKLISDHIQSHSNRLLNKINLTASQFRYLEYLNQSSDPVSFKDVEKHFQTSQPTVSGIMKRLAEKNLIVIEAASFGRAKNARLTEKGRKLIDESGTERGNEEKLILSALKEEERESFHDMLERINKKLS